MARKIILICLLLLIAKLCPAQSYQWITGGGSSENMVYGYDYENVTSMITDTHGNVYITATVGATNIKADTFYEALAHNTFHPQSHVLFASYKCDGTMRWAKLLECSDGTDMVSQSNGTGNGSLAYSNGNIYLAGAFHGATKYIGYDTTFTNAQSSFTARFDTSGHLKWIRFVGPDVDSTLIKTGWPGVVAIDGQGYIHNFNDMYPGVQLTSTYTEDTNGTYDLKYDSTGNLVSAKRVNIDSVWVIAKVQFNQWDGKYYAQLLPNGSYWTTYRSNYCSAIGAFNPNGTLSWIDSTSIYGWINSFDYKGGNSIYVCGFANGIDTFKLGGKAATDTLWPSLYNIAVVCRLDTNGVARWIYNLQSNQAADMFSDITILSNNRVASIGYGGTTSIHGADSLIIPWNIGDPMFLIVDSSGHTVKLDRLHADNLDNFGTTIASDAGGNVYIGGEVTDTIFAAGLSAYHSNGGNTDFFLAKYGYNDCDSLLTLGTSVQSHSGILQSGNILVYPNPATGLITITNATDSKVQLFNTMGQKVYSANIDNDKMEINISTLLPGTYLVLITDIFGNCTNKTIIKE